MILAALRLLVITLSTLICGVFIVFILRSTGSEQSYAKLKHPLIASTPWLIIMGGDSNQVPAYSLAAFQSALTTASNTWLGLIVRQSSDGEWFVFSDKKMNDLTESSGFFSHFKSTDLYKIKYKKSTETIASVEQVFLRIPAYFYIDVAQPPTADLKKLFQLIEKHKLNHKVILTSTFINTMKDIREYSYDWLTGSTAAELAKARLLSALYLEPLITLTSEVVTLQKVNVRLADELRRRHRIVLLETSEPTADLAAHLKSGLLSGIVTTRPTLFRQLVAPSSL